MKQFFRFALWMLFVIGHLQGKPVDPKICSPINMDDLGFNYLQKFSCAQDVTFPSPANVQKNCYAEALKCFMQGLGQAEQQCTGERGRIDQTLGALEVYCSNLKSWHAANSSECQWERKEYQSFVKDLQSFAEQLNVVSLSS